MLYDYTMKLLFWWRSDRVDDSGRAPLHLRITIAGKRAEYETEIKVPRSYWPKGSKEIALPEKKLRVEDLPAPRVDELNSDLRELKYRAERFYKKLRADEKERTARVILDALRGRVEVKTEKKEPERVVLTVAALAELFMVHKQSLPEAVRKRDNTFISYRSRIKNINSFLQLELNKPALPAAEVGKPLLRQFERWCLQNGHGPASMRKQINMLQMIISHGVHEGLLLEDRIQNYDYQTEIVKTVPEFLPLREVMLLHATVFDEEPVNRVVSAWLFCCATGLSWVDYCRFARTPAAFLHTDEKGNEWIRMVRKKMERRKPWGFSVPFFPEAKALYLYYHKRLPYSVGTNANKMLHRAEQALGLSKSLTTKLARSTFSQLRRDEGWSDEAVSAMMGDTVQVMNASYSRISETRISAEMSQLVERPVRRLIPLPPTPPAADGQQNTGTND